MIGALKIFEPSLSMIGALKIFEPSHLHVSQG
jgi:hypothetical protein